MSIVDYADSASEDVDGRPMAAPPKDDLRIIFPDQPEKKATWPAPGNWARRYVHRLVVLDASVGLLAGGVAFAVRFGKFRDFTVPYLIFSAALPLLWLAALALGRAYEQRFLFDGNDDVPQGAQRRHRPHRDARVVLVRHWDGGGSRVRFDSAAIAHRR
ncbi:hypothetical protein [Fodinicola feengrottensis]|uniref:hypothetical protein n=1 Tax=Fodinicola feengrottensis TaxID=435914 RepID=UPI002442E9A7|nr:hypothetical protein [Fodinicola feengrottensis]